MNKLWHLTIIFLILLISACSVNNLNRYFMIDYYPKDQKATSTNSKLKFPLKYSLEIRDLDINRIYDRNSIVIRNSMHSLNFDPHNKWALRPDKAITDLLIKQMMAFDIFSDCRNNYIDTDPDYILNGRINNVEFYESQSSMFAHLNMILYFRDGNENIIFEYKINRKINLKKYDVGFFVKVLSDCLKNEFENLNYKIITYFENKG